MKTIDKTWVTAVDRKMGRERRATTDTSVTDGDVRVGSE